MLLPRRLSEKVRSPDAYMYFSALVKGVAGASPCCPSL